MRQAYKGSTGRKRHEPYVDMLPEAFTYRDDGCEVATACLRCPLPQCKYDDPAVYRRGVKEERDRRMRAVLGPGGTGMAGNVERVAEQFGVSARTVVRAAATGKAHTA